MSEKRQMRRNDKRDAKQRTRKSTTRYLDSLAQQQIYPATLIKRAQFDISALNPHDMSQLQRMIGNQAVGKLLSAARPRPVIQAKRLVGDSYEQEADHTPIDAAQGQQSGHGQNPHSPIQQDPQPTIAVQRTLDVNGVPVTAPGNVQVPIDVGAEVFRSAISKLIGSSTNFSLTTGQLTQLAALLAERPPTSMSVQALNAYASIVAGDNVAVSGKLQWILRPENLRILGKFFQEHPGLAARVGIDFTSISAVDQDYGGGVYNRRGNKRVEIGSSVAGESNALYFLRTVIHETGHATFQQMLVRAELSTETVNGTIMVKLAEYEEKVRSLEWQLKKGLSSAVGNYDWVSDKEAELKAAQAERDRLSNNLRVDTVSLTEDGTAFYEAWKILRREEGRYMLGLALSDEGSQSAKSPKGRQRYMAGSFNEFCAESFMYMALSKGALYRHYRRRRDDPNVPGDVKQALATAFRILEKYETRILDTLPWLPSKLPVGVKKALETTRVKAKDTSLSE